MAARPSPGAVVLPLQVPQQAAAAAQAEANNVTRAVSQAEAAAASMQQSLRGMQPPYVGIAMPPGVEQGERRAEWRPLPPPVLPIANPPPFMRSEAMQGIFLERLGNVANVNVGAEANRVANVFMGPRQAPALQATFARPLGQPAPVAVQIYRVAGGIAIATPEGNTIFIPIEELLRAVPELQQRQTA